MAHTGENHQLTPMLVAEAVLAFACENIGGHVGEILLFISALSASGENQTYLESHGGEFVAFADG